MHGSEKRNMNKRKLNDPSSILIEVTAGTLAAEWYEIGRRQGLTSKHKTVKGYVNANVEKFIPKAVDILLSMLGNPSTPEEQKVLIYDALSERVNDPNNVTSTDIKGLPALDIKKLLDNLPPALPNQQLKKVREKPINVLSNSTAIGKVKG